MFGRRNQDSYSEGTSSGLPAGRNFKVTLIIGIMMALFSVIKYYSNDQVNPITGEHQHVSISVEQEVAIGLQSTPQMVQQYGGYHPDHKAQEYVQSVGRKLINNSIAKASDYSYAFHLLSDREVVNAFALPGGQVFITEALFSKLQNEDQLAGVLGHEIGHVIHRHGAERIAKMELTEGLTGAAVIASGDYNSAQFAQLVGNLVNMKYGRDQELASDAFGVELLVEAGYDPFALVGVMDILEKVSGGQREPEFQSTHPSPENRREKIIEAIKRFKIEK